MSMRKLYLLILPLLMVPALLGAQGLPELKKAPEINVGKLPNGISYYLIKNTSLPGFADFALVQPGRSDRESARRDLVRLPNFHSRKPYAFLADNSVGYGKDGFIRSIRGASIFSFDNVPVSEMSVSDSTLLMIFDIARSSEFEQALVVAGDIDVNAVKQRIQILSMTISSRLKAGEYGNYLWRPQEKIALGASTSPIGTVTATYRSPRTGIEMMNTLQPVISDLFASELFLILGRRLKAAFSQAGIPLADYSFDYTGSAQTTGDERFTVKIWTDPARLEQASSTLASVLGTLDRDGVSAEEILFARGCIREGSQRDNALTQISNAWYMEKCIASYLYGSNLASDATLIQQLYGRKVDAEREKDLLNRYISAMLDPSRNLHLNFSAPEIPSTFKLSAAFSKGWAATAAPVAVPVASDTLSLPAPSRKKLKLKTSSPDSFSGGKLWTFSNGVNVLFRKTSSKGAFRFGYVVSGGWNEVRSISGPESAFVEDVASLRKVAGMSGEYFSDLLSMNGVSLDCKLSLSDLRYTGSAPSGKLTLVLKALLALTGGPAAPDADAYDRYRAEKALRLIRDKYSVSGTMASLDSTACPTYKYAYGSLPELPGDDFPGRVEEFRVQKCSSMRNGLIVLVGDLDEQALQKHLCQYLGAFKVSGQRVVRPRIPYPLRECWSTVSAHRHWRERRVTVSLAAQHLLSTDANLCLRLCSLVLETELGRELIPAGVLSTVYIRSEVFPSELAGVVIDCVSCPPAGTPAGAKLQASEETLAGVRKVLHRLATKDVDARTLARCRTMLLNRMNSISQDPGMLCDAMLDRHAFGRAIQGNFKEVIYGISASQIREMFAELEKCQCEYAVQ